jgi:hypothetical protein
MEEYKGMEKEGMMGKRRKVLARATRRQQWALESMIEIQKMNDCKGGGETPQVEMKVMVVGIQGWGN